MEKKNTDSLWDKNWQSRDRAQADNIVLFNKGNPKNIIQFWQRCYYHDLKSLLPKDRTLKFLELGCGRATTSMYLASDNFTDITLLDFSSNALSLAKEHFVSSGFPIPNTVCADAANTKLESNQFDCIYNVGLLEHFADPAPIIAESYRILKNDGFIFMPIVPVMPYRKSMINRILLTPFSVIGLLMSRGIGKLAGNRSKAKISSEPDGDAHIERTSYGAKTYVDICKKVGFSKVVCVPYNPYWKVNKNKFFERNITLPLYRLHYNLFLKKKSISLQCSDRSNICLLLIAHK